MPRTLPERSHGWRDPRPNPASAAQKARSRCCSAVVGCPWPAGDSPKSESTLRIALHGDHDKSIFQSGRISQGTHATSRYLRSRCWRASSSARESSRCQRSAFRFQRSAVRFDALAPARFRYPRGSPSMSLTPVAPFSVSAGQLLRNPPSFLSTLAFQLSHFFCYTLGPESDTASRACTDN